MVLHRPRLEFRCAAKHLLTARAARARRSRAPLDDPGLRAARDAVDRILTGHEPFPALAIDAHWTLLASNRAVAPLLTGVDPSLLAPPVNVMRLSLHPHGLAQRIVNLVEWRAHMLARLEHQIDVTADAFLIELREELRGYPTPIGVGARGAAREADAAQVAIPFVLRSDRGVLSFLSTTTVFGTPVDVTLSELALEAFFPADAETAARLRLPAR
jgi:hypothetical protein